jgi:hypothetical protein
MYILPLPIKINNIIVLNSSNHLQYVHSLHNKERKEN